MCVCGGGGDLSLLIFTQHHKTLVSGTGGVRSWRQYLWAHSHAGLVCSQDDSTWLKQGSHLQFQPRAPRKGPSLRCIEGVPCWAPPCGLVREWGWGSTCDFKGLLDSGFLAPVPSWHSNNHGQHARQSPWSFEKGGWGLRLRVRVQTPQVLSDKLGHWGHGRLCRACGCPETLLGTDSSGPHLPACTQMCGHCCSRQWCR